MALKKYRFPYKLDDLLQKGFQIVSDKNGKVVLKIPNELVVNFKPLLNYNLMKAYIIIGHRSDDDQDLLNLVLKPNLISIYSCSVAIYILFFISFIFLGMRLYSISPYFLWFMPIGMIIGIYLYVNSAYKLVHKKMLALSEIAI